MAIDDDKAGTVGQSIAFDARQRENATIIGRCERTMLAAAGVTEAPITGTAALHAAGHIFGAIGADIDECIAIFRKAYETGQRAREVADRIGKKRRQ